MLVGGDRRFQLVRLRPGQTLQTHRGVIPHDDLIGRPWGSLVATHTGHTYYLVQPSIHEYILRVRRTTQVLYPKEAGYMFMRMNIGPGIRVIEAGTGSGGLTMALAHAIRPDGRIYSYEIRPEVQQLAQRNLEELGLADLVKFTVRDIADGFDETGVDALFLDLPNPWDYLPQVHAALASGGYLGAILPTANQVIELLYALERNHFGLTEVEELLLRSYKTTPARLRPMDRMIAHTGFLIFARSLVPSAASEPPVEKDAEGEEENAS